MKIESLQITNFGHFSDLPLTFSPGLQVIHGPNEAGKTTLLEFLRGWLFDFDSRSPYNFKGAGEMTGSGIMTLSSGCRLELVRRKGNRRKIQVKLDGDPQDMDDEGLLHLLSNANEHVFRSVFAFGLKELAAGEESLKHESLQSALFGGGLGISAGPERILSELQKQAETLFSSNSRAQRPLINTALRELKDLSSQLSKKNLKSDDYHQCRRKAEEAEAKSSTLRSELEQLRTQVSRLKRLADAWPKWLELQQLQREIAALPVPPSSMSKDVARRMEANRIRRRELLEDKEQCEARIRDAQSQAAQLKRRPEFIKLRSAIKHCLQDKKSYLDAKRDLPQVEAQASQLAEAAARSLAELRPGWTVEQLREFRVELRTRSELDQLLQRRRSHNEQRHAAERSLAERSHEAELAQAELSGMETPVDTAELQLILQAQAECSAAEQSAAATKRESAKLQAELTVLARKLTPLEVPEDIPISLVRLPVPRLEAIDGFEREYVEITEERKETARTERTLRAEWIDAEQLLKGTSPGITVPSLSDRDASRLRRETLWKQVERLLLKPEKSPPGSLFADDAADAALAAEYKAAVDEADRIADHIYAHADVVAKREELSRRVEELRTRLSEAEKRAGEANFRHRDWEKRWNHLWKACGFIPLTPDVMKRWLEDFSVFCQRLQRREETIQELDDATKVIDAFRLRLKSWQGRSDEETAVTIARIRERIDSERARGGRIEQLKKQAAECDVQRRRAAAELEKYREHSEELQQIWESLCVKLNCAPDEVPEHVGMVIDRLETLRQRVDATAEKQIRIRDMQARVNEFTGAVRAVCETAAPEWIDEAPDAALDKLTDELDTAIAAEQRSEALSATLSSARTQLQVTTDRLIELDREQGELHRAAGVDNDRDFATAVEAADRYYALQAAAEQRNRDIALHCGSESRESFETALGSIEPGVIDGQIRDAVAQEKDLESQKKEADGNAAVLRKELERMDGVSESAAISEELSRKRAALKGLVDRYAPIALAQGLLKRAIDRFEKEHQPALASSTSDLLSRLTDGRYTGFERARGEVTMIVRRKDGAERTADQLSTGTREQLYLAIRLAYVLHYCTDHEPLPIIMDNVLVNFDRERAKLTLQTLAQISRHVQVLYFTCHDHMLDLLAEVEPQATPLRLERPALSV